MADDIVSLSGEGLKFGRFPANGELLIGNGSGLKLSTLTAGSNVTITNSSGGISISATSSGGTVTSVTGTAPITSTGGATPNIALTTPVAVQYGGTGLATITSNNLMVGNGTGAVSLIAPGTSGNLLTSNGTTWASAAPPWYRIIKTSVQTVTGSAFVNDTQFQFPVAANKVYIFRADIFVVCPSTGNFNAAVNGPASPSSFRTGAGGINLGTGSYDTTIVDANAPSLTVSAEIIGTITTGATAGTLSLRWRVTSGTSASVMDGSWLEWAQVG
jgi:hypothetical protein